MIMNKHCNALAVLLVASTALSQQTDSVESILNELKGASKPAPAPAVAVAAPAPAPAVAVAAPAPAVEAPVLAPAEVENVADESMRLYSAGDYAGADAGFKKVLRAKPDHALARYFQGRIDSRNLRNGKEASMDAVVQEWNGMILRSYAVTDEAISKFKLGDVKETTDVSGLFDPIPFKNGAYAEYRPGLKQIAVLNTPDYVAKMEGLLTALSAPVDGKEGQVEIETRFVEFSQGALEELGFNWKDLADGQAQTLADDWNVKDGEALFSDGLRSGSDMFAKPGAGTSAATGNWSASRLADGFSDNAGQLKITGDVGPNIDVVIKALDQASGTDVLSAPRVVTRVGKEAVIQVGEKHYFPEVFEVGANEGTILRASYQGFAEKLMGVELKVKPVLVENDLIKMDMNPVVNELIGWRPYEIAPANSSYTFYQYRVGMSYEHDPVIGQLPIIRSRQIKTQLVMKDGSTVGMGGLIYDKKEQFSDRVPVLGSIPLIGRLFRSEGERSVKRNLTIFVTARKVAPNGRILSEVASK
jgi:type II secretory pathway component GspD/PulD (secretin)